MKDNAQQGFTLIEVLIALAILAIALVAIIKVAGQSVSETDHVKEKFAAHLVAMNAIAGFQIGLIPISDSADQGGQEKVFGQNWHWSATMGDASATYQRIMVKVSLDNSEQVKDQLVGFVRKKEQKSL